MQLIDKIKKAVTDGINESFDIDDMRHDIDATPSTKQKVCKTSKIYG